MTPDAFTLGKLGEAYVFISLRRIYAMIKKTPDVINIQLEYGDFVASGCRKIGFSRKLFEVKTERKDPNGNFYFERWSNQTIKREGWLRSSKANELYYLFWDEDYGFRFPEWQRSAFIIEYIAESDKMQLTQQKRHEQNNDTWGYLFPQNKLEGPFSPIKFALCQEQKMEAMELVNRTNAA